MILLLLTGLHWAPHKLGLWLTPLESLLRSIGGAAMDGAHGERLRGPGVSGSPLSTWRVFKSGPVLLEGTRFGKRSILEISKSKVKGRATQSPAHSPLLHLWVRGEVSPGAHSRSGTCRLLQASGGRSHQPVYIFPAGPSVFRPARSQQCLTSPNKRNLKSSL